MKPNNKKNGFTMAETLLTLALLGIVAAVTIPGIFVKHKTSVNRTKVRKAFQVYNTVMHAIINEKRINSNAKLQTQLPLNNCSETSRYFSVKKVLPTDNGTTCKFMTGDGVYWDISDIQKVVVALEEDALTASVANGSTNKAFYMISNIDSDGVLRINDISYETDSDKVALIKLYDFINGKQTYNLLEYMANYCAMNNTYSCVARANNDINACPTYACKYQLGAWADKACPAELAVADLRDCQRCKPKENLCDVFDENGFHRLKIYNCSANYTQCKTIQERNDNDKTITQLDYKYTNGQVSSYSEKRLKDDGKTIIKQWNDCNVTTTFCASLYEYYDNGKTVKTSNFYNKDTGILTSTVQNNSKGNNYLNTYYNEDGTLKYYDERTYDETGTKNLYKKTGCNVDGNCSKYYVYIASGEAYKYKYEYQYYNNSSNVKWMKEYTDDGSKAISTTSYDSSGNITKIELYGDDGKTVIATQTGCNSSGVCSSCTGTGCP